MADNNLQLLNDNTSSPSESLLPVVAVKHGNGEWDGVPAPALASKPAMADFTIYIHALRRHWLLALGIGLLLAGILGPAVWIVQGTKYTAYSVLQISMQEIPLLSRSDVGVVDRERFEIYKSTQQNLLLSRFVLSAAIGKPEVARIPVIQESRDPVDWLTDHLSISFPGKAEVMMVSLKREDPQEAQKLVKAVVDAYITEVVNAESDLKLRRLDQLEKIYAARDQDIRGKREQLKRMASDSGSSGSDALNTRERLILEQIATLRSQNATAGVQMGTIKAELAAQKALQKNADTADVPAAELDSMVANDPIIKELSTELAQKRKEQEYARSAMKQGAKGGYFDKYGDDVDSLQRQYNQQIAMIHAKAREKRRHGIETEIVKSEALLKAMSLQERKTLAKIDQMTEEAKKFGMSSVTMDMAKSDLSHLEVVQSQISTEMEKLRVEIKSAPRIAVREPADLPLVPSNTLMRAMFTAMAVLGGLCFPVALVVLWDIRTRRINTTQDVSEGLQLPVIGSMPLIPAKVIRQLGSPSPRHRAWHLRLTESVDGITARLLHKADMEQSRVIMVSSAASGEGKTTLATQLALSLARTGRQTVLVDFDLRRPSFDEVFGVPLSPGVSELLRHESEMGEMVHASSTENLSVVAAGRWNRQSLASLSNGGAVNLFKELRENFDFVVVDTSPILPVADARFVSKFVDTVVLSVFRDVSEAAKIQATCDILAAFGVRSVEAVVTGASNSLYGKHSGYESTVSA
jgi:polysaccharide biosynthesis transport protein